MQQTVLDLLAGNMAHTERVAESFDHLQAAQQPEVVTVCCGDSRVLQDDMWDNDRPGTIFTHSNIGNRVAQETDSGQTVAGDVLYPLVHTNTHTAVVVGHTGCGAVTAAYDDLRAGIDEPESINYCIELLESQLKRGFDQLPDGLGRETAINYLVEYNVDRQIEILSESSAVPDEVDLVGAVYDFQDVYGGQRGEIHIINVGGNRDVERLRERHSDIESRINRLWEYEYA